MQKDLKEQAKKFQDIEVKVKDMKKLIDNSLLSLVKEREEKELKVGIFWPSMIGDCMRKVYYMYKLGLREPNERSLKIMFLGTTIHNILSEALQKYGNVNIKSEVEVDLDLGVIKIHGRADNVILLEGDKASSVIEVKTISSRKSMLLAPKFYHVLQLIIYMKYFNASDGYLVYVYRDDLSTKVFYINYDEGLFNYAVQRLMNIHKYILEDKEPPPEAKLDENMQWQCHTCPYRRECEEKISRIFEKV